MRFWLECSYISAFIRKLVSFSQDTRLAFGVSKPDLVVSFDFPFNNEYGAGFYRFDEAFAKVGWPLDSGYRPQQSKPLPAKYPSHAPATGSGMELTGIDGNLNWQTSFHLEVGPKLSCRLHCDPRERNLLGTASATTMRPVQTASTLTGPCAMRQGF